MAEEGADEAAKRYLIPNRVVAKGVQLRLLRQRVVMPAQKAQADVLLHRLHYALPGCAARSGPRFVPLLFLLLASYENLAAPNAIMQSCSVSSCSQEFAIALNAGSSCPELWSWICSRRLRSF